MVKAFKANLWAGKTFKAVYEPWGPYLNPINLPTVNHSVHRRFVRVHSIYFKKESKALAVIGAKNATVPKKDVVPKKLPEGFLQLAWQKLNQRRGIHPPERLLGRLSQSGPQQPCGHGASVDSTDDGELTWLEVENHAA